MFFMVFLWFFMVFYGCQNELSGNHCRTNCNLKCLAMKIQRYSGGGDDQPNGSAKKLSVLFSLSFRWHLSLDQWPNLVIDIIFC